MFGKKIIMIWKKKQLQISLKTNYTDIIKDLKKTCLTSINPIQLICQSKLHQKNGFYYIKYFKCNHVWQTMKDAFIQV